MGFDVILRPWIPKLNSITKSLTIANELTGCLAKNVPSFTNLNSNDLLNISPRVLVSSNFSSHEMLLVLDRSDSKTFLIKTYFIYGILSRLTFVLVLQTRPNNADGENRADSKNRKTSDDSVTAPAENFKIFFYYGSIASLAGRATVDAAAGHGRVLRDNSVFV